MTPRGSDLGIVGDVDGALTPGAALDDATLAAGYRSLWADVEAVPIDVLYDVDRMYQPRRQGAFERNWSGRGPRIWIFRELADMPRGVSTDHGARFVVDVPAAPLVMRDELCTLAHEFGHHQSWARLGATEEWQAYERAALSLRDRDSVTAEESLLILAEEERAWDLGREALSAHGVPSWPYFDERRTRGLENYRVICRRADPAPEEV